jgi:hypothetical protein
VRRPLTALLAIAVWLAALLLPATTDARPGGGHGFSGGSRGGGSRGGGTRSGGGGGALPLPCSALAIVIFIVVYYASRSRERRGGAGEWSTGAVRVPPPRRIVDFEALRARDPEFSRVLFEDFAYALFAQAHRARHDPTALRHLLPYLAPAAAQALAQRGRDGLPVLAALIGSMRVTGLTLPPPPRPGATAVGEITADLTFEANLVLDGVTHYVEEQWRLGRVVTAVTRPWKGVRSFGCPACGAPFEPAGNRCASCGKVVDGGRLDWAARRVTVVRLETAPPLLTGTVEERGTDSPTVYQPGMRERWEALLRDDPGLGKEAFGARLALIFAELNAAWAAQDLARIRPFVSDGLYGYLRYWVEAYRAQGLVNKVEGARIERWAVAKVERDKHYDALTVRLWGTGRDVTIEVASGRTVGGNPSDERRYSEYWTLIRGASVRGAPRADKACPGCGAHLRIAMGGNCEYCGALVTSGDFDWVLSRIEQDDVYVG